jgi:hypothetical protein
MNVEYRDSELPFRDIGQCIYCGDKTSPLSREHVLPKGLDGANSPRDFNDALENNADLRPVGLSSKTYT